MSLVHTADRADQTPRASRAKRAWSWVGLIALIVVIGGTFAVFDRQWQAPEPLAADSPRYDGALAVTTLLTERGVDVVEVDRLAAAREELTGNETLVVTDPTVLHPDDLRELATDASDLVVLGGDAVALEAVIEGTGFAAYGGSEPVSPACDLPVAASAGAIIPGTAYDLGADATGCYPVDDGYALLTADIDADSTVTVLDGAAVLVNEHLATEGHAALAFGLLGTHDRLIWYLPSHDDASADGVPALGDFVPTWVTPVLVLATLVGIAAAVWRGRRFGPLVAETLPVTVRASETLDGRARLYRAADDPAHALAALRRGAAARLSRRLGLSADASAEEVAHAIAAALARDPRAVLHTWTAQPHDEAEFAELADHLRDLEHALGRIDPWEGRAR